MSSFEQTWPSEGGVFSERIGLDRTKVWLENAGLQDLVRHFHLMFGSPVANEPQEPTYWSMQRRMDLIREEFNELADECCLTHPDLTKVAHEAGDLLIVVLGLFVELGIDADSVVREIMRANFTKDYAGDNAKPVKGERFRPADIEAVVNG